MDKLSRSYQREKFSRFTKAQVDVIAAELTALERSEGEVRVSRVLELARNPGNPLHEFIDWNDRSAAEKWRVEMARRLCRAVRVVYTDDSGKERANVPMLVSVTTTTRDEDEREIKQRSYISSERALSSPHVRQELIDEALRQAEYWQEKYRRLGELGPVFEAIAQVKAKVTRRRKAS